MAAAVRAYSGRLQRAVSVIDVGRSIRGCLGKAVRCGRPWGRPRRQLRPQGSSRPLATVEPRPAVSQRAAGRKRDKDSQKKNYSDVHTNA